MDGVMPTALAVIVAITAAGAALVSGAFWVFSVMVIPGLRRTDPASAVAAMQQINVAAIRPPFLFVFLGTAMTSAAAAIWAITAWSAATPWIIAAAACYLVGALGVTVARNVPLNNALAEVSPESAHSAAETLRRFASGWAPWNHVRAVASLATTSLLVGALAAFGT